MSSIDCRLTSALAGLGAFSSVAITVLAGAPAVTAEQWVFTSVVAAWACVPYAITAWLCHVMRRPTWRSVMSWGLLGYAAVDVSTRVRGLYFPTGSTDSLVVLFLPVFSPVIVTVVGGAVVAIASALQRPSR
jgi:hypothetical protein